MTKALSLLALLWCCYASAAVSWVFEGDSTTAFNATTLSSWQLDLTNYSRFLPSSIMTNGAIGGTTSAQILARYTNSIQKWHTNSASPVYLSLRMGINELGSTAWPTSLANWSNEVYNAQLDGFTIINYLVQSRTGISATGTSNRLAWNAAMSTNPAVWLTIDMEKISMVGWPGGYTYLTNYSDTALFYDGLHPTALTDSIVASNFNYAVGNLLNPPTSISHVQNLTIGNATFY